MIINKLLLSINQSVDLRKEILKSIKHCDLQHVYPMYRSTDDGNACHIKRQIYSVVNI